MHPSIRLVGASQLATNVGILQIRTGNGFGSVCGMNAAAASVACRQMGFKYGSVSPSPCRHYGGDDICAADGSAISMQQLVCMGGELEIHSCMWKTPDETCAKHDDDAVVFCGNVPASRLIEEGSSRLIGADGAPSLNGAGRLEIFRATAWSSVCTSGFTRGSAQVACKRMGFSGAAESPVSKTCHHFPHEDYCGTEPPDLSELSCDGSEGDLLSCTFEEGSDVFCAPAEAVVLHCSGDGDTQGRPSNRQPAHVGIVTSLPERTSRSYTNWISVKPSN